MCDAQGAYKSPVMTKAQYRAGFRLLDIPAQFHKNVPSGGPSVGKVCSLSTSVDGKKTICWHAKWVGEKYSKYNSASGVSEEVLKEIPKYARSGPDPMA